MARRFTLALVAMLALAACTAPRTTQIRKDAVLSGAATATTAADAARAAEKSGDTGVLIASSNRDQPTSQPTEPVEPIEPPTAAEPTLDIMLVKGAPTMKGEPIPDLAKVITAALVEQPGTVVIVRADSESTYESLIKVLDIVSSAGASFVIHSAEPPKAAAEP